MTFFFSELQDINTNAFFHPSSFSSCLSESLIFDYFYFHSFGSLTVAQTCTAKAAVVETMRFGGRRNLKMKLHCIFVTRDHETCENLWCQFDLLCLVMCKCEGDSWDLCNTKETSSVFKQEFSCYNEVYSGSETCLCNVLLRLWLSYLEEIKSSSVHIVLSLDVSVALQLPSLSWDITK